MLKVERSTRGRFVFGHFYCQALVLAIGCVSGYALPANAATFPSASGGGFFSYDGSSLTLDTSTAVNFLTYSPTEFAFLPSQDPAIGSVIQLTGVTQIGNSLAFTNGTFSLTLGTDVLMSGDIINVALSPTGTHTADVNPGLGSINLANLVINQPISGTSRLITDWLAAAGGSGMGSLGLTLTNTDAGSLNPLVAPASGNALFTLEPAVPEPASMMLILLAGGCVIGSRRRKS